MLHFLCGAVTSQRLAVGMEHERTYLLAHERQNNRTANSLHLLFQARAHIMDVDFIFDSERLVTEVEKRPALYI